MSRYVRNLLLALGCGVALSVVNVMAMNRIAEKAAASEPHPYTTICVDGIQYLSNRYNPTCPALKVNPQGKPVACK